LKFLWIHCTPALLSAYSILLRNKA
jgi:hypothetical protein